MSEDTIRYNRGAQALHWIIALLIIANLATGLLHDPLEDYVRLMPLHKSTGITILLLSLARIAWRFTWTRPPYPDSMSAKEVALAKAVQALFYVMMVLMPVTGWITTSAGKYPLTWFGLVDIPKFSVTRDSATYAFNHEAHEVMGFVFLALVALHVGAALRHQFLLKDGILRRMV
ncbi:cytochrome b [Altererythrobacter sp.]|uniref:cytochrome b n=1 Tax=Altererythrobacter sp. TaxID=1872480 RepID=UPI003D08DB09